MAIVTGYTADHMDEIEASVVVSGSVVGDELMLQKQDGTTIDAGNVRGPQGDKGDKGDVGPAGPPADQIDLITPWLASKPLAIAHRGAHNLYPENSMEGFRAVAAAGFPLETDIRFLSSGEAVLIHDDTTDRTMTATGSVASLTLAQWRSRYIKPQLTNGDMAAGAMWIQFLNEFGGRYLLVPEIKIAGTQDLIIQPVIDRQLQQAVIFQSFDLPTAQAVAAAGCQALYLTNASLVGTTPADLFAAGIKFVGFATGVTATDVAAAKAAGLTVFIYTVDKAADWTTAITTKGADGVFTDDPWFVTGRVVPKNQDPFQQPHNAWPHMIGFRADTQASIDADTLASTYLQIAPPKGLRSFASGAIDSTLAFSMDWMGVARGPRLRIRFTATFLERSTSSQRWVGMFVGSIDNPDMAYNDTAVPGQNGYNFFVRRTGAINIYRVAPSTAPTQIATSGAPTTPLVADGARSQPSRMEIVIDATTVKMTNLTTGTTTSVANNAFRGASKVNLTVFGTDVEVEDIGIEELP